MAGRRVDEAGPRREIGDIGDPQLVGPLSDELAVHQVRRAVGCVVGDRRLAGLATHSALQAQDTHQSLHGAAGHTEALTLELPLELPGPLDAEVLFPNPLDLSLQGLIPLGAPRQAISIHLSRLVLIVG